jgi:hypothetical protein
MTEPMRSQRHVCQHCRSAHAGFFYGGRWKARLDHDLCMRCFRALMDRLSAQAPAEAIDS